MKRTKHTKTKGIRAVAVGLTAALAASLFLALTPSPAAAFTSLNQIETIKQSQSAFRILEIVPTAGTGSIGYYIAGQEPVANWYVETAKLSTPDARKAYVDGLFNNLMNQGLMNRPDAENPADTAPLTLTSYYGEKFPWEITDGNRSEYPMELQLETAASATVTGSFTYAGDGLGAYQQNSKITFDPKDPTADLVQNIVYFYYGASSEDPAQAAVDAENGVDTSSSAPKYYYSVTFNEADTTASNLPNLVGTPLYTKNDDIYTYAGTLKADGSGFNISSSVTYYTVGSVSAPSATWEDPTTWTDTENAPHAYLAKVKAGSNFRPKAAGETGYFTSRVLNYVYAGANQGDYNYTNSGSTSVDVVTDKVFIKGGFRNNNWFLRKVFDMSPEEIAAENAISVTVLALTPDAAGLDAQIERANLIVLSAGYSVANGGAPVDYTADKDITKAQSTAIQEAANSINLRPILVDYRVASSTGPNMAALAQTLSAAGTPSVSGNIYCFVPDASQRTALATGNFSLPFTMPNTAYSAVLSEIQYENFLRKAAGRGDNLLPEEVHMANCLRYIINYVGHRVENQKSSIHVLDLEPQAIFDDPNAVDSSGNTNNLLTEATVRSWLPSYVSDGQNGDDISITITHMSTAEFIGKIDDINEQFDLIYVGANLHGFYTSDGKTVYNDSSMNGLIYSNIGDSFKGGKQLLGLLDSEYHSSGSVDTSDTTYRLSGNDITPIKKQELQDFAASGLPIIIADELIQNQQDAVAAQTLTATIDPDKCTREEKQVWVYGRPYTYYTVTLSVTTDHDVLADTFSYQWYKDNNPIPYNDSNGTAQSATLTYQSWWKEDVEGTYYCVVTPSGSAQSAKSNSVKWGKIKSYDDLDQKKTPSETSSYIVLKTSYDRKMEVPVTADGATYQWYQHFPVSGWREIDGADERTYQPRFSGTYRCVVTITGTNGTTSYTTQQCTWWGGNPSQSADGATPITWSVGSSEKEGVLSAQINPSFLSGAFYQWYRVNDYGNDNPVSNSDKCAPDWDGTYYCQVTFGGQSAYSHSWKVGSEEKFFTEAEGTLGQIPGQAAKAYGINPDRVDCCSQLYSVLYDNITRPNVLSASKAVERSDIVLQYLNLSKPEIILTRQPTEYTGVGDLKSTLVANRTLEYIFTIENATDPTPASTRYTCNLYLDQNYDGRHNGESEILSDPVITDSSGRRVENGTLQANVEYKVFRTLPNTFSGLVYWKLEVVKAGSGNESVHASQSGYSYVKPDKATEIKILHVRKDDNALNFSTNLTYTKLYKYLEDVYTMNIKSETVAEFNGNHFDINGNLIDIRSYIMEYDMLIIGCGDCYGNLKEGPAQAVVDYIKSGKAILFMHDTTSFCNLDDDHRGSGGYADYWGYYFNTLLRDPVGLDRYGVTNTVYGVTSYKKGGTGGVANGYSDVDKAALQNAGYTVAYQPKSKFVTLDQTQGYTKFIQYRYSPSSSEFPQYAPTSTGTYYKGNTSTNWVTQTNKGPITQYPFKMGELLQIPSTHDQYYQLNMNSDDIVVWYCLGGNPSGDNFNHSRNDVTNAYYIYNRGNVTYSGAGHTSGATDQEAQLFVNTMIAAYRAAYSNPNIRFSSSAGDDISMQILPLADSGSDSVSLDGDPSIYFVVDDPNLTTNKVTSVEFYYEDEDGTVSFSEEDLKNVDSLNAPTGKKLTQFQRNTIYRNETNSAIAGNLSSNIVYRTTLSSANLAEFIGDDDTSKLNIYIRVVTQINTIDAAGGPITVMYHNFDKLTLVKSGLFLLH